MELFLDLNTAEKIAWGLFSFIALIVWCRWMGTPEDQKKNKPPEQLKEENRQAEIDQV